MECSMRMDVITSPRCKEQRRRKRRGQQTTGRWTTMTTTMTSSTVNKTRTAATFLLVAVVATSSGTIHTSYNNNVAAFMQQHTPVGVSTPYVSSCRRPNVGRAGASFVPPSSFNDNNRLKYRIQNDLDADDLDDIEDGREEKTPKPPTTLPPIETIGEAVAAGAVTSTDTTPTALSGAAAYSYFAVEKKPEPAKVESPTSIHDDDDDKATTRTPNRLRNKSKNAKTLISEIDDVLKDVADVLEEVNSKLSSLSDPSTVEESDVTVTDDDSYLDDNVGDVNGMDQRSPDDACLHDADQEEVLEEENTLTNVIQNYFAIATDDEGDDDGQYNSDCNDDNIVGHRLADLSPTNGPLIVNASSSASSSTATRRSMRSNSTNDELDEWSLLYSDEDSSDEYDDVLNSYFDEDGNDDEDDGAESPIQADPIRDFTFAIRDVAVDGSLALLKGLRYTAAAALTATLPKKERKELMERIVTPTNRQDVAPSDDDISTAQGAQMDPLVDLRGSVQEEIALAVREVARRNEELWQEERDVIAAQLEEAANARVEAELKIQQQRLDQEKEKWQKTELEAMRADLKEQIAYLQQKLREAEDAKQQMVGQNVSVAVENAKKEMVEQEAQKLEDLQRLLRKRRMQQEKLDAVEESLKRRAAEIKAEKQRVERLERQKNLSSALSSFGTVQPGVISSAPSRSTHKLYRSLSQDEQMKLMGQQKTAETSSGRPMDQQPVFAAANIVHPVLGPLIADLGYKKIYLSSSEMLGTIPIWSRQRTYRNDRARRMAADKARTLHLGFPGAVCLFEDMDGSLSILDGQHRIGMMQTLIAHRNKQKEKRAENGDTVATTDPYEKYFENVLVEVYSNNTPNQMNSTSMLDPLIEPEQVFLEINKAEPVHLVDMPGVAPAADRMIITEAVETLQHQFPQMFSPSQKCRVPNVNVDNLRNSIFGANVLKRIGYKDSKKITSQHLLQWLLIQNARLGDKYESYFEERGKPMFVSLKAWEKASQYGFYLGLESSWLYSKK